jgi:phage-related protein
MLSPYYRKIYYYKDYYLDFFNQQSADVQKKFNWTLELFATLEHIPGKYFKHVEGTRGIYEIRVEFAGNIYRAFSFFDEGRLIVIANGFQKKSMKTPKMEIDLAKKIKKEYFDEKGNT